MKSQSSRWITSGIITVVLLAVGCGETSPEKLLEKSRQIPALHDFGTLYVPLYQQAMIDSNWTAIRENIVEIERLKIPISRLDCPPNLLLQKSDWETNQRLFVRGVGYLNLMMGYRGTETDSVTAEIVKGVQGVYDYWSLIVDLLR